eukprot:gene677-732_t
MSWFGFGGSSQPEDNSSSSNVSSSMNIDEFDSSSFDSSSLGGDFSSQSLGGGSFQEQLMIEQQKMIMQAVMIKLTDLSFERCVTKPSTSLSYNENTCINASVGKFVDTSQLVMKRFQMAQDGQR